jgi:isopenicillin-N epimerase
LIIVIITAVSAITEPLFSVDWMLDPNITYLNHGSFGARVQSVFEFQLDLKREFEREPVNFLDRQLGRIDNARQVVSSFLGADPDGFGFVDNATTGVGCVVQSLQFDSSDEILTTSLVYNGVRQLLSRAAKDANCSYREVHIQLPVQEPEEIVRAIVGAITSSTKLLVVDHVSSASSIIFPVQEIARFCREKDIFLLIDGAHAPGMLDQSIDEIGTDWYVGNLHKWVCAPIGTGFLWASNRTRDFTHPMTVSHWYGQGLKNEFDWQGTRDVTAWITSAEAVKWGDTIGWELIREHNHSLAVWMQAQLVEEWNVSPLSPLDGSMFGSMVTVPLPSGCPQTFEDCLEVRNRLFEEHLIEVPIFELYGRGMVRVSAQLYSKKTNLDRLIIAINEICA